MDSDYPEKLQTLHAEIGHALTTWVWVEDFLCQIFRLTINADGKFAATAYHAIISFETRLAMTDAVVKLRLQPNEALLARWTTLANRISKKSKKRAELAHCQTMGYEDAEGNQLGPYAMPFWALSKLPLQPLTNKRILMAGNSATLSIKEISERRESFANLFSDVRSFASDLGEWMQSITPEPKVDRKKARR